MLRLSIQLAMLTCLSLLCFADEPCLLNVKQITFTEMGFEKAGEAYFSPDGDSILFQAIPKGQKHYQIFRIDLAEGIPRLISTGKGACTCAFFRPDGKKIIFASSHSDPVSNREEVLHEGYKWDLTPYMNIYEADPDGSHLTPLTSGSAYHAECAYSPDGKQIVYASNETGSMNLYIMDSDGNNVRFLTTTEGAYNGGPFFSPDGTHVIFRADRTKKDYLQIYMIDVTDGIETQLTDNDAVNWAPFWHPDGDKIAFTTSIHGHHRYEVYMLHIPTKAWQRITDFPDFDGLPVFSADGKKIMWTSKRSPDHSCQIFIADFINPFES